MGEMILVTGGARSGKSSLAEGLAEERSDRVLYIATAIAFDDEMKNRIAQHRQSRPRSWDTHEGYKELHKVLSGKAAAYEAVLLDCVTVMITNLMWDHPDMDFEHPAPEILNQVEKEIKEEFIRLLAAAKAYEGTLIMVTNELGSGLVPEHPISRGFRDIAGRINQLIAAHSHQVYLTVCGIPVKIK
jgi:adenosylcobinamide kinase/adenosylcobinamide-phosphate guanylyltransferase